MAYHVHRIGFTVLYDGVKSEADRPTVNIVFVHGLWGHPRRTWEARAPPITATATDGERRHSEPSTKASFAKIMRTVSFQRPHQGSPTPGSSRVTAMNPPESTSSFGLERANSYTPSEFENPLSKSKIYWPQDLLPLEFPDARIMTYGYDADVIGTLQGDKATMNNFTTHGQNLMVQLNHQITDNTPIILVAHSLGGIIVKDALHRSKTNLNEDLRKMHGLTKSILFLGTPHRGSDMASWSEILTKIVRLSLYDTRRKLVSSLRIDSEILEIIQSEFVKMLYKGDFRIHCFQEGKAINPVMGKVVDDISSKFDDFPMQTVEIIDASHREMVRFRSEQDPGFRQVTSALRHYISIIKSKDRNDDVERKSVASTFSAHQGNLQGIFSVPYARNPEFVGRVKIIQDIEKLFAQPEAGKNRFVAIHGLGGIGKSQVAVELAYRWKDSFPTTSIAWIHASNSRRLDQSYQDILTKLNIPETPDTNVKQLVENYLRDRKNGRWLMIVDNVDDESVVLEKREAAGGGSAKFQILSSIPEVEHGAVLFTSRYKKVALKLTNELLELAHMTEEEGETLLMTTLRGDSLDTKDIKPLLEELGYIPLAISHAAAFIRENCLSISSYLEIYKESEEDRVELLNHAFDEMQLGASDSDIPVPVLSTWSMSFNYVLRSGIAGPLASEVLSVMSFMDRQEIPKWLLRKFNSKASKFQFETACGTLKAISLILENSEQNFSMHRLVQLSMRRWLQQKEKHTEFAAKALLLLADHFPDGSFKTWKVCSALVVHAETVLDLSTGSSDSATLARLLANVATFQSHRGKYLAAQTKFEEVVKLKTELLGAQNQETLAAMDSLALTLRLQGKYDAAESLAEQTARVKVNLLGAEDPSTLSTVHILATLLGDRGKHAEAEVQNRQIWEMRCKVLGADHLDTLNSASNLALSIWELGRFTEAEKVARTVLSTREKALGEENPLTLEIASTLGFILEASGKLPEAEELKRHILSIRQRVLGPDHPDTADSLHDMGWILHQEGFYHDAEDYYDQALSTKVKILGEYHPKTLTTLCNFPVFYCDRGEYNEAIKASYRIVRNFERIQGPEHPQTVDALGDMVVNLRHSGDLETAERTARRCIEGRIKVNGPDHPWTLPVVSHLGYILTLKGQHTEGEALIRKCLVSLEEQLGRDHPNTFTSSIFLSKNLMQQGSVDQLKEAEVLAREALEGRKRILGPKHPYTWKTMYHLSSVLCAQRRYAEAEQMCREALGGMQSSMGSEHPDVTRCDVQHSNILELLEKETRGGTPRGEDDKDKVCVGSTREAVDEAVILQLSS